MLNFEEKSDVNMKVGVMVAMESERNALRDAGVDNVILTGIGKVNAAMTATEFILEYKPDCIISSGVAGGIDSSLRPGDFVLGRECAYYDVWCGEGNLRGQVQGLPQRFRSGESLLSVARRLVVPGVSVHEGLICTGDRFLETVNEAEEVKSIYPDALACDMESAAVAQVCVRLGVPFVSFRAISDVLAVDAAEHWQSYEGFWDNLKAGSFAMLKAFLENL